MIFQRVDDVGDNITKSAALLLFCFSYIGTLVPDHILNYALEIIAHDKRSLIIERINKAPLRAEIILYTQHEILRP